jgi:hypothetical protein
MDLMHIYITIDTITSQISKQLFYFDISDRVRLPKREEVRVQLLFIYCYYYYYYYYYYLF